MTEFNYAKDMLIFRLCLNEYLREKKLNLSYKCIMLLVGDSIIRLLNAYFFTKHELVYAYKSYACMKELDGKSRNIFLRLMRS